jgi:hypothetical protein
MSNAGMQSAEGVADVIYRAAVAKRPKARYTTSPPAKVIVTLRWILTDALFDGLINGIFHLPKRLLNP